MFFDELPESKPGNKVYSPLPETHSEFAFLTTTTNTFELHVSNLPHDWDDTHDDHRRYSYDEPISSDDASDYGSDLTNDYSQDQDDIGEDDHASSGEADPG